MITTRREPPSDQPFYGYRVIVKRDAVTIAEGYWLLPEPVERVMATLLEIELVEAGGSFPFHELLRPVPE